MPLCPLLATDLPIPNSLFSKMGYIMAKKFPLGIKKAEKNLNSLNNG